MKLPLLVGLVALGMVMGLGMYTTDFTVYLGHDPNACNNCHVMDYAYENWFLGRHARSANCVDCHAPHETVAKYLYKAKSGLNDVFVFSTGLTPDAIRAKPETKIIVQANCIRCHNDTVDMVADGQENAGRTCWSCHRTVAHGVRGLTMYPHQDNGLYPSPEYFAH